MRRLLLLLGLCLALPAAGDTRVVDSAQGPVEVPAQPQRIVSLHDAAITHPLTELGAPVVGSAGRIDDEGRLFIRGVRDLHSEGFEELGIEFLGTFNQLNAERIAMLEPDLIIAPPWQQHQLPRLEAVAPVVVIPWRSEDMLETYRLIAEASGRTVAFERLHARYRRRIAALRRWIGEPAAISIALVQAYGGQVTLYRDYGAFNQVVRDVGFAEPAMVRSLATDSASLSAERLPDLQPDYLFSTFEPNYGQQPRDPHRALERALPGWCGRITACREGRFIVLHRSKTQDSFAALDYVIDQMTTHIPGRGRTAP